jgi:MFS family permease
MRLRPQATHVVLALICIMYFITYMDRVNISTAASEIQKDLHLSTVNIAWLFTAFAWPYLMFQVFGGWVGDRFGPRQTLFWCGMIWAVATILTGLVSGFLALFLVRVMLGFGEGATFPTATRAMQNWVPPSGRGFAQGLTHSFARLGNAATPPLVAYLMLLFGWRGSFVLLGVASLLWVFIWAFYFRNNPKDHPNITASELQTLVVRSEGEAKAAVPWGPLLGRMWPVTVTYFCYGWCLWLYLNWLPLFFKNAYSFDIQKSALFAAGVFFAGVLGDALGGIASDAILRSTKNVRLARLSVIVAGFCGAFLSLLGILFYRDITIVTICLSAGFFCAELVIGPMWAVPMDITPKFSGTAAGLMNSGSALAAIVSPLLAGYAIEWTGNWHLPFLITMVVLGIGALCAFLMHPEQPFEEAAASHPFAAVKAAT